jgi:uncharacterized membrane protein YsdA (DUF1294 family)/cold shock CspA family protein
MKAQGKIVTWNDEKGFGFIAPSSGGNQVFVHIKAFPRGASRPAVGTDVKYCPSNDAQGRARAEKVRIVGTTICLGLASKAFIVAMLFLTAVAVMSISGLLPAEIFWLYFIMSILTFGMYARDKSAAKKNALRAPEKTLHILALLGGWPGALYAQQLLRHKSSKASFRTVFWVTLALNVFCLGGYLMLPNSAWLYKTIKKLAN